MSQNSTPNLGTIKNIAYVSLTVLLITLTERITFFNGLVREFEILFLVFPVAKDLLKVDFKGNGMVLMFVY